MPRAFRGHALLGFLLLAGLAASAVCLLLLSLRDLRPPRPLWLGGSLALTAGSALALGWRDRAALLRLLLFATATPALLCALWAALAPGPSGGALHAFALLALLAALPAAALWHTLSPPDTLPNVLAELAPPREIVERDGLQFYAQVTPLPDGTLELRVAVQSCVDQERRLTLRLRSPTAQRLGHPAEVEARLGPAEVGLLRVPLHPTPSPTRPDPLSLLPRVWGPAAARVRHGRAGHAVPPLLQALLAGRRTLEWGGGWRVPVPRVAVAPAAGPARAPSWELLWAPPSAARPPAARRSA